MNDAVTRLHRVSRRVAVARLRELKKKKDTKANQLIFAIPLVIPHVPGAGE